MSSVAALFGRPIHKEPIGAKGLPIPFAKVGIEIEVENCPLDSKTLMGLFPNWKFHVDDSLRNSGMEFTTPGGLVGVAIQEAIEKFCPAAEKAKLDIGYPRAGIHLHIDCTDMNEKSDTELLNMALVYMLYEHAFFGYAGEWRRACGFCDALLSSQDDFPNISAMLYDWKNFNMDKLNERSFSKYAAVNFLPLSNLGTVEFRHLPTTFDVSRILGWVNMCLCMKRYGKNIDEDPVETLMKHGPEVLTKIVFRGFEKLIKPYIDHKKIWAAMPEVMALKLMRKAGKLDPWEAPDNPLLEGKRLPKPVVKPKPSAKKLNLFEAVIEEGYQRAAADAQPAEVQAEPPRRQWGIHDEMIEAMPPRRVDPVPVAVAEDPFRIENARAQAELERARLRLAGFRMEPLPPRPVPRAQIFPARPPRLRPNNRRP